MQNKKGNSLDHFLSRNKIRQISSKLLIGLSNFSLKTLFKQQGKAAFTHWQVPIMSLIISQICCEEVKEYSSINKLMILGLSSLLGPFLYWCCIHTTASFMTLFSGSFIRLVLWQGR